MEDLSKDVNELGRMLTCWKKLWLGEEKGIDLLQNGRHKPRSVDRVVVHFGDLLLAFVNS